MRRGPDGTAGGSPYFRSRARARKPTPLDKLATIFAAEQNLRPWEVKRPRPSLPISDVGMETRRPKTVVAPRAKPPSLNTRYRAAIGAPVNAPIGKKHVPARELLAQTMTAQRRQEYLRTLQPPAPHRDTSLLHALAQTPMSMLGNIGGAGGALSIAMLKQFGPMTQAVARPVGPATRGAPIAPTPTRAQQTEAIKSLTGRALYNDLTQLQLSHPLAAGTELALLGLPAALKAAGPISRAVRQAGESPLARRLVAEETGALDPSARFVRPRSHPKPESRPPSVEEGGQALMRGMGQAERLTREQKRLRSEEVAIRAKEVERILNEVPGEQGLRQASAAMRGPLPKINWDRFTEMNPDTLEAMAREIRVHPAFEGKPLTRRNAEAALRSIVHGNLPRPFERKLLTTVFGEQATSQLIGSVGFWKKAGAVGLHALNVPRTLQTAYDVSAVARQALLLLVSHPSMVGKEIRPMFKAMVSPSAYEKGMETIANDPVFDLAEKAGVPFTNMGSEISKREEAFASNLAEKVPGVKASGRAFNHLLNNARLNYFKWMLAKLQATRPEIDIESAEGEKILKGFARVSGNATGRGQVRTESVARAMQFLNAIFFAPRLFKTRIDFFNPRYYLSLDPIARREVYKQAAGLAATVSGLNYLAYQLGAGVQLDPRSADWGKIKIGNTRFDIAGGMLQPLRLVAQLEQNKIISSTTGKTLNLGPGGGYGHLTRLGVAARFGETKLSPPAALTVDLLRGTDFNDKPVSWDSELYQRMVPLLAQDSIDLYNQGDENALAEALAIYGIGMWGIGTQTYGPTPAGSVAPAGRPDYTWRGGTNGSPYFRPRGSAGSPYFRRR